MSPPARVVLNAPVALSEEEAARVLESRTGHEVLCHAQRRPWRELRVSEDVVL